MAPLLCTPDCALGPTPRFTHRSIMCRGYNTLELDSLLSGQLPHQEASQWDPFDEHRFCVINEGEIRGYGDLYQP